MPQCKFVKLVKVYILPVGFLKFQNTRTINDLHVVQVVEIVKMYIFHVEILKRKENLDKHKKYNINNPEELWNWQRFIPCL